MPAEQKAPENSNVTQALINVQSALEPLKKATKGGHGKYADLTAVMEALQPLLDKEKLAVIPLPDAGTTGSCSIKTILRHAPTGEEIVSTITVPMQRANDPQAFGAAMTYARRYALLCMFNMVTEDDDAAAVSMSLEKLLKELATAADRDELYKIREGHLAKNYLQDKFWSRVYGMVMKAKEDAFFGADAKPA